MASTSRSLYSTTSQGLDVDDLVTGEAVALEVPAASFGLRMASGLLDLLVEGLILFAALMVSGLLATDEALAATFAVISMVGALLIYPTLLETLTRGRSVGKLVMGLRTVRDDGGPITFDHAYIRTLVGFVEVWVCLGIPALISSLVTVRQKRVGDLVAGTYVVRDRISLRLPLVPSMPPELAAWARQADLAPLPPSLNVGIRQLLGRGSELSPVSREQLVRRCAAQVMELVAPPPPRGTPPDRLLAAVQAERRARDLARLQREEQLCRRLAGR